MTNPNPVQRILAHFAYRHLAPDLQKISKPFGELARTLATTLPMDPELTVALRKLLEAKDCAVRARLAHDEQEPPAIADDGVWIDDPHGGEVPG